MHDLRNCKIQVSDSWFEPSLQLIRSQSNIFNMRLHLLFKRSISESVGSYVVDLFRIFRKSIITGNTSNTSTSGNASNASNKGNSSSIGNTSSALNKSNASDKSHASKTSASVSRLSTYKFFLHQH